MPDVRPRGLRQLFLLLITALVLLALPRTARSDGPLLCSITGHWYEVVAVPAGLTWTQARDAAAARSYQGQAGYLATATTPEENAWLVSSFPAAISGRYFIGGYETPGSVESGGGWHWVTGEPWEWAFWNDGEPNNGTPDDVLGFWTNGRWWDTTSGDKWGGYVVEYGTSTPQVPPGFAYDPATGHWYERVFTAQPVSWREAYMASGARTYRGLPGHLLTVSSAEENALVELSLTRIVGSALWIGGVRQLETNDARAGWRWVTGEPWSYLNWANGEPNNVGGGESKLLWLDRGLWNDAGEASMVGYLIEYEPPLPPPAGLVHFGPPRTRKVDAPQDLCAADLDGDGFQDILVRTPDSVAVLYGDAEARLSPPTYYFVGSTIDAHWSQVTTADLNRDGRPDLVCAAPMDDALFVWLNQGGRAFGNAVRYSPGGYPSGVTAADFNEDGWVDLAVASQGKRAVVVLLNRKDGTLASPVDYGASQYSAKLVHADFNGDGHVDLAVVHVLPGSVKIFLGDGTGRFASGNTYRVGSNGSHTCQLITDDFNGDGKPDLAAANTFDNNLQMLFGDGTGGFTASPGYFTYAYPNLMDSADLDGDGDADIVTPNNGRDVFTALLNDGTGVLDRPYSFPSGGLDTRSLTIADFNGDGRPDVATGSGLTRDLTICLNLTRIGPPSAPTSLTARALASLEVDLAWVDGSSNETGFEVERKGPSGGFSRIASLAKDRTSYRDGGLATNTQYTYRVRAMNAVGASAYTNEASATTPEFSLPAPSGLTATAGPGRIDLAWTDNSSAETTFEIERKTGDLAAPGDFLPLGAVGANITQFTDATAARETLYTYRVRATNAAGFSAYSNPAAALIPNTPPAAPSALKATAVSARRVDLAWSDLSDNESGFEIERKAEGGTFGPVTTTAGNTTAYTDVGVQPDTLYTYRVRAINVVGSSPYSSPVDVRTPQAPPAAPAGLALAVLSQGAIRVTWQDVANETGYKLERKTGTGEFSQIMAVGANVLAWTDVGLASNTRYTYRVRAWNASGDGPYSGEASAVTDPDLPTAPADLVGTPESSTVVVLSWRDTSTTESGFKVERRTDSTAYSVVGPPAADATQFRDTGLMPATRYRYRVRATNAAGDSPPSNEIAVATPPGAPAAPSGLAVAIVSATELQLSWQDNSVDEDGFRVERRTLAEDFREIRSVGAGERAYRDTGLAPNTEYAYRVRAYNAGGVSGYSNVVTQTTPPRPPAAPASLRVVSSVPGRVELAWTDASSDEIRFRVERKTGSSAFGVAASLAAGTTSYVDKAVSAGTAYTYRVFAVNGGGDSPPSNEVTTSPLWPLGGILEVVSQVSFGTVPRGRTIARTLRVRNRSLTAQLRVTVAAPRSPFRLTSGLRTVKLAPGGSENLVLEFRPGARGAFRGTLRIDSSDPRRPRVNVVLTGSGR